MGYRAKHIPTGKYYRSRTWSKLGAKGSIFHTLSIGRLRGWLNSSSFVWKEEDWVIEEYVPSDKAELKALILQELDWIRRQAPSDFLGTGSCSRKAEREEREWNDKFNNVLTLIEKL